MTEIEREWMQTTTALIERLESRIERLETEITALGEDGG